MKINAPILLAPVLLAALASSARADFLDGRVVNALGQGVPGVNINVNYLSGGGHPNISNDGTDANGFFHTTVPAGTYEIEFLPPAPPLSNALPTIVSPVTILGTTDIGTVTLPAGVGIVGRVVNGANVGVAGINLDILDASGTNVALINDQTDAAGNIAFATAAGSVRLRLDTTTVVGQTLAPREIALDLVSDVDLGTIVLPQGYLLTAIVHRPGNLAVNGCDLDVFDQATGLKLYTPSDNTNSTGLVDTIIPGGTFHFDFCPPAALGLAAGRVGPLSIAANTFLGTVNLVPGVTLAGNVTAVTGVPVVNASIKVHDQATGVAIPICDNNTDASGHYQVIIPTGTYSVDFKATAPPWSRTVIPNVVVSGNSALNAVLPFAFVSFCFGDGTLPTACPCGNSGLGGHGCQNSAGTGGALLSASGWVLPDSAVLNSSGELASALSIVLQGTASNANGVVFGDGVRCAAGSLKRLVVRNATAGSVSFPQAGDPTITARSAQLGDPIPSGAARFYQVYYRDPNLAFCASPQGNSWNVSNAVQINW